MGAHHLGAVESRAPENPLVAPRLLGDGRGRVPHPTSPGLQAARGAFRPLPFVMKMIENEHAAQVEEVLNSDGESSVVWWPPQHLATGVEGDEGDPSRLWVLLPGSTTVVVEHLSRNLSLTLTSTLLDPSPEPNLAPLARGDD